MRNLKRALSLTLASVMLLGMMVVGTSAAGFPDVDDADNVEAIEVLQAVGIMVGDKDTGNFRPDAPVSRAEMAVVMAILQNLTTSYYVSTCPFTDVSGSYDWARGPVGACYASGVISGRSATSFDPAATVTAVEAAAMMLRALGYFKYTEDYADGFNLSIVRQANNIGLFNGIEGDATTALTRNQVAKLTLNALRSEMVDFTGTPGIEVNGVKVGYRAEYTKRSSSDAKFNSIAGLATTIHTDNGQYYIQLGEQRYDGKLRLTDGIDVFGRPARIWEYDGKDIGTYEKKELLSKAYTDEVTGKMLYELLTKATLEDKDYSFHIAIDGETEKNILDGYGYFTKGNILRSNTETVGNTGKGVLTQVYVDPIDKEVYIAVINTYLAKADGDYNEKKDEVSFDVWSVEKSGSTDRLVKNADNINVTTGRTKTIKVSGEDFDIKDVKKDDIVLVTIADETIQSIDAPQVLAGSTINAFKDGSWVKSDGTQYDYASSAQYDVEVLDEYSQTNMKDTTYNIYLDAYGYLIGVDIIEKETNYVFLAGIDTRDTNLGKTSAEGRLIFLDGTDEVATINLDKSRNAQDKKFTDATNHAAGHTEVSALMNTWCTYTKDKNGVYTLTEVANTDATFTSTDKAGQSRNEYNGEIHANTTEAGDTTQWSSLKTSYAAEPTAKKEARRDVITIDKKHVTLNGINSSSIVSKAYGNDATIYLSAKTMLIDSVNTPAAAKRDAVIITGVGNIATGVRNVNLTAYTAQGVLGESYKNDAGADVVRMQDVSQGVYTLFSNKGYVIAAMVVGEDGGASSNYVYVTSEKASQEGYLGDDEWEWTREVILNGAKTEITEKGDKLSEIGHKSGEGNMLRDSFYGDDTGNWYKVTYKADGTVYEVEPLTFTNKGTASKFIKDISDVEESVEDNDTVILFDNFTAQNNKLTFEGNTLHVEAANNPADHEGFPVDYEVKVALIQDTKVMSGDKVKDIKLMDKIYEYDGVDGLAKAIKDMNLNNNFKGYISAVFEGGLATSVIIYDKTETEVDWGTGTGSEGVTGVFLDNPAHDVMLTYEGSVPGTTAQRAAVTKALMDSDKDIESVTVVDFVDAVNGNTPGSYKVTFNMKDGTSTQMTGRILLQSADALKAEDIMAKPATDGSGVITHKNNANDNLNISTQNITMSGNTITVNSGMSISDRGEEKIQNLEIKNWGFGGYDKFFLIELTPPAGMTSGHFQAKYSGGHNPSGTFNLATPDYPNVLFAYNTSSANKVGNYVDIRWSSDGVNWGDWTRIWINLPEAANP